MAGVSFKSFRGTLTSGEQPCAPYPGNAAANFFSNLGAATSPVTAAQRDFERAACEYRNCIAVNPNNLNACEGFSSGSSSERTAIAYYAGSGILLR
jgi:hypothetical protein